MCGIFGITSNIGINTQKLKSVSKVISHRGPDDEGILLLNFETNQHKQYNGLDTIPELHYTELNGETNFNAALLHRRLSIIDISSAGHQPMAYNNNKLWITYNGEVYNYIEIKAELISKGYKFVTESDTEVILAAYQEWGTDCVNHFNGMWSFAIWDSLNNLFFLSRDRVGVKPFYYCNHNNQFIFCSEIKGIVTYLENKLTLNKEKIYEYLIRGQIFVGESEDTIFEEVKQLMPGNNLIFKNNKIKINKYWNLELTKNKLSFNENVERFSELFLRSINYRLRSDVEVGSCLSGGLDSSSLVSFASKNFNKNFHTFSAIWPGEKCDESYYVEKVNNLYECYPHAFTPDFENIIEVIDKVIWYQEMPLAGSSLLAQWFVMEKAKKHNIKVLLDGQGADEILSGYPLYLIPYINEMIFSFKWNELYKHYDSLKKNGYPLKRFFSIQKHRFINQKRTAFPIKNDNVKNYVFNNKYASPHKCNYLPDFLVDQIVKTNLPGLLHFEDRNSMAHSVESRVPFLDYELLQFAISIPTEQKIHGSLTKIILREAMKKYLPVEVYNRTDKIGFSTPIEQRLFNRKGAIFNYCLDIIENSELNQMDLIDKEKINSENVFGIYTLAKFLEIWR
ncbi:MAG: asparagine synthase (glutamine-hydrolyzing) [Ignavibacterium sp.]|nr:asparagine synthase (glutamine-hydrolyzing) [Ignavibacterium sp.]